MRLVTKDFSGCWGIDCSVELSAAKLQEIVSTPLPNGKPIEFIIRYVFFRTPGPSWDLTAEEAKAIWACKSLKGNPIGLSVVVHPRLPRLNSLTADLGTSDMQAAIRSCIAAGYDPTHISPEAGPPLLSPDIEGVLSDPPTSALYLSAAASTIVSGGFRPGPYIGYQTKLAAADLSACPGSPLWWADFQGLPEHPQPPHGWAVHQHPQVSHCGVPADPDEALAGGGFVAVVDADLAGVADEDPLPHHDEVDTKVAA